MFIIKLNVIHCSFIAVTLISINILVLLDAKLPKELTSQSLVLLPLSFWFNTNIGCNLSFGKRESLSTVS